MRTAILYAKDGILYSKHYLGNVHIGGVMFGKDSIAQRANAVRSLEMQAYAVDGARLDGLGASAEEIGDITAVKDAND